MFGLFYWITLSLFVKTLSLPQLDYFHSMDVLKAVQASLRETEMAQVVGAQNAVKFEKIKLANKKIETVVRSLHDMDLGGTFTEQSAIQFSGNRTHGYLGVQSSFVGDVNGDGFDDALIGARGAAFLVFGSGGGLVNAYHLQFDASQAVVQISGKFYSFGFLLDPYNTNFFVGSAGDVNNDGYDDILVSPISFITYVIFGRSNFQDSADIDLETFISSPLNGFRILDEMTRYYSGYQTTSTTSKLILTSAGDINKDGYDDILIGNSEFVNDALKSSGGAMVIYGMSFNTTSMVNDIYVKNMTSTKPIHGFTIVGANSGDYTGISVSSAGDINKDGFSDIIIGVSGFDNSASNQNDYGCAVVIYGKKYTANILLANTLPSQTGFRIQGSVRLRSFGDSVSGAGDLNKDGYADFIVGGSLSAVDYTTGYQTGVACIFYGKSTLFSTFSVGTTFDTVVSNGGFRVLLATDNRRSASIVRALGDVNGDGFDDILINDGFYSTSGSVAGKPPKVYILYGKSTKITTDILPSYFSNNALGFSIASPNNAFSSVSGRGDFNGDGYTDIMLGRLNFEDGVYNGIVNIVFDTANVPTFAPTNTPAPSAFPSLYPTTYKPTTSKPTVRPTTAAPTVTPVPTNMPHIDYSLTNRVDLQGGLTVTQGYSLNNSLVYMTQAIGDFNGDGVDDFVSTTTPGYIIIYYGKSNNKSPRVTIPLNLLTHQDGFVISKDLLHPVYNPATLFVGTGCDLNGDGYDELVLHHFGYKIDTTANAGAVYIIYGRATNSNNKANLTEISLGTSSDGILLTDSKSTYLQYVGYQGQFFGIGAGCVGDLNNDGYNDLAVGVLSPYSGIPPYLLLIFGKSSGLASFDVNKTMTTDNGIKIIPKTGIYKSGNGYYFDTGDYNHDGIDDMLYGDSDSVTILYGKKNGFLANVNMATLDSTQYSVIYKDPDNYWSAAYTLFPKTFRNIGDVNNDGYIDILVGSPSSYHGDYLESGTVYVIFGVSVPPTLTNLSTLAMPYGYTIYGERLYDHIGLSLYEVGDVNCDGIKDFAFSEFNYFYSQPITIPKPSRSYVIYGQASSNGVKEIYLPSLTKERGVSFYANNYSVRSIFALGDINQDGCDDLYVGAPASVIYGRASSVPTATPTAVSSPSLLPSAIPSAIPSAKPSSAPSAIPTETPTETPSLSPSSLPTSLPTTMPSPLPTCLPSADPTTVDKVN